MSFLFSHDESETNKEKHVILKLDSTMQRLVGRLALTDYTIRHFYMVFEKIDRDCRGFIEMQDFMYFMGEGTPSIMDQYVDGMFQLAKRDEMMGSPKVLTNQIPRIDTHKFEFSQFACAVCVYCLMTKDNLIRFVYLLISNGSKDAISKRTMILFMTQRKNSNNEFVFPYNYIQAVEEFEIDRADKISFTDFKKAQNYFYFFLFPAFKLQEELRAKILGEKFWQDLAVVAVEREHQELKKQQNEQIKEERKKFMNERKEKGSEKISRYFVKMNKRLQKQAIALKPPGPSMKQLEMGRKRQRTGSDSLLVAQKLSGPPVFDQNKVKEKHGRAKSIVHEPQWKFQDKNSRENGSFNYGALNASLREESGLHMSILMQNAIETKPQTRQHKRLWMKEHLQFAEDLRSSKKANISRLPSSSLPPGYRKVSRKDL